MAASNQSFQQAGEFFKEHGEDVKNIYESISSDSGDMGNALESVGNILSDVDKKAKKTHQQEEHTVKLGQKAEENPTRESVKEFEVEHEKEIEEIESEEKELGKALKKLEGAEQYLEKDIQRLEDCMKHTDKVIGELNQIIEEVNRNGLGSQQLLNLAGWMKVAGMCIDNEAKAHELITMELERLAKMNQNAIQDEKEIEEDVKGVKKEDKEGEHLAKETHNKNLAKQEKKDEKEVQQEVKQFKKEEKEEEKITQGLEKEFQQLENEMRHTEEELNNLDSELEAVNNSASSLLRNMSGGNEGKIENDLQAAQKEIEDARKTINKIENEYPNLEKMLKKEDRELSGMA